MELFTQYTIEDGDGFDENLYPSVAQEINDLQQSLEEFKSIRKVDIVISLLKDHSIKTEWFNENKELVGRIIYGTLRTPHLESLFTSCKGNPKFASELEAFIQNRLT